MIFPDDFFRRYDFGRDCPDFFGICATQKQGEGNRGA